MTIRVLVVDDHPVVRAGITMVLGIDPAIEVVAEADDGLAAIDAVADHAPDVVLMDLQMPGLDGVEATERIRSAHPDVRVLVLTTYDTDRSIVAAVEAGATGYLLKDTPPAELIAAIKAAAEGHRTLAPGVADRLDAIRLEPLPTLTDRELEVLTCIARGASNAAAARELFVSQATVKTHLIHIFQKLDASDRTSAVTRALELGLIEL